MPHSRFKNIEKLNMSQLIKMFTKMWKGTVSSFTNFYNIPRTTFENWRTGKVTSSYVADIVRNYLKDGEICNSVSGCICKYDVPLSEVLVLIDGSNISRRLIRDLKEFHECLHIIIFKNKDDQVPQYVDDDWINIVNALTNEKSSIQTAMIMTLITMTNEYDKAIILSDKYFNNETRLQLKQLIEEVEFIDPNEISLPLYLIHTLDIDDISKDADKLESIRNTKTEMMKTYQLVKELRPKTYKQFINYVRQFYVHRLYGANTITFAHTLLKFHEWDSSDIIISMNDADLRNEVKYCSNFAELYYCYDITPKKLLNFVNKKRDIDSLTRQKLITWINER